jgi:hypothetical protein
MVGVLALLTGWALLVPLVVMALAFLTGRREAWMGPFLDIAASAPLLIFMTLGGLVMLFIGVRKLSRQSQPPRLS